MVLIYIVIAYNYTAICRCNTREYKTCNSKSIITIKSIIIWKISFCSWILENTINNYKTTTSRKSNSITTTYSSCKCPTNSSKISWNIIKYCISRIIISQINSSTKVRSTSITIRFCFFCYISTSWCFTKVNTISNNIKSTLIQSYSICISMSCSRRTNKSSLNFNHWYSSSIYTYWSNICYCISNIIDFYIFFTYF